MYIVRIVIWVVLFLIFSLLLSTKKHKGRTIGTTSNDDFVVSIPKFVMIVGTACAAMSITVMVCFTVFSYELPHYVFYIVFGGFLWLGMYLVIKSCTFKVIVKNESITVYSFLRKYSFTFNDIETVKRQVKNNRVKSERIIVKTITKKRVIVESSEISYKRFIDKIVSEVDNKRLNGFDGY